MPISKAAVLNVDCQCELQGSMGLPGHRPDLLGGAVPGVLE
jgi:hypothetical protein